MAVFIEFEEHDAARCSLQNYVKLFISRNRWFSRHFNFNAVSFFFFSFCLNKIRNAISLRDNQRGYFLCRAGPCWIFPRILLVQKFSTMSPGKTREQSYRFAVPYRCDPDWFPKNWSHCNDSTFELGFSLARRFSFALKQYYWMYKLIRCLCN